MQHKPYIRLSFVLGFFVCTTFSGYAMEEENKKPSRLHLPNPQNDNQTETENSYLNNAGQYFSGIPDNPNNFFEQQAASSIRQNNEKFNQQELQKYISDSPEELQDFIEILKTRKVQGSVLYQKSLYEDSPIITLVGPPGVGKSSLARAIPQYCGLDYTFIKGGTLHNQYQYSAESTLNTIVTRILGLHDPHVIILDEMEKTIKHDQSKNNNNAAEVLWELLDEIEAAGHILFIATANKLEELPKQLRQRLSDGCYTIELPDFDNRKDHINFYISTIPSTIHVILSSSDIDYLAKKTHGFAPRDLCKMMVKGNKLARISSRKNQNAQLTLTKRQLLEAIEYIKKNNGIHESWQTRIYKFIQPAIAPTLQIGIPLVINLGFNYYMQMQAGNTQEKMHLANMTQNALFHKDSMIQAEKFHLANLAQSEKFHTEGLTQTKTLHDESIQQGSNFHNDQMRTTYVQMACDAGMGAATLLKESNPPLAACIGVVACGIKFAYPIIENRSYLIANGSYLYEKTCSIIYWPIKKLS